MLRSRAIITCHVSDSYEIYTRASPYYDAGLTKISASNLHYMFTEHTASSGANFSSIHWTLFELHANLRFARTRILRPTLRSLRISPEALLRIGWNLHETCVVSAATSGANCIKIGDKNWNRPAATAAIVCSQTLSVFIYLIITVVHPFYLYNQFTIFQNRKTNKKF